VTTKTFAKIMIDAIWEWSNFNAIWLVPVFNHKKHTIFWSSINRPYTTVVLSE